MRGSVCTSRLWTGLGFGVEGYYRVLEYMKGLSTRVGGCTANITYIYTYIYIYTFTHTHIYIYTCTHVHVSATHVDSQFFIHIYIHKRVCSFTHLSEGHGSLNALCGVSGLCVGKLSQTPKGPCAHILDTLALNYLYRDYFKAHEYILYRHMDP